MPNARSRALASGAIQSVVHGGESWLTSSTSVTPIARQRFADHRVDHLGRRTARIGRRDLHHEAAHPRHATSRTMPSSTIEMTGTSGSGTVASAAQTTSSAGVPAAASAAPGRVRRDVALRRVSPLRSRIGALQKLHLRQQVAEMLGVHALLAAAAVAALHPLAGGQRQRRLGEHRRRPRQPGRAQRRARRRRCRPRPAPARRRPR